MQQHELIRSAIHEAAHCAAYAILLGGIISATVGTVEDERGEVLGQVEATPFVTGQKVIDHVVAFLCGAAAQADILHDSPATYRVSGSRDFEHAENMLAMYYDDLKERDYIRSLAKYRAMVFVSEHHDLITRIAEALLASPTKRIDGATVRAIVEERRQHGQRETVLGASKDQSK